MTGFFLSICCLKSNIRNTLYWGKRHAFISQDLDQTDNSYCLREHYLHTCRSFYPQSGTLTQYTCKKVNPLRTKHFELTCLLRFPNSILRMQQPLMLTGKDNGTFCFHLVELQLVQYSKIIYIHVLKRWASMRANMSNIW